MSHNNYGATDKRSEKGPSNQLDLWSKAIDPTEADEFLSESNLGLGNYGDKEYWQQVESFKKGLYADAAFSRVLIERAIDETKTALAEDEWQDVDGDNRQNYDRRRYLETRGEEIWESLSESEKALALEEKTGLTRKWTSPFHRMLMMRHESSRSKDARLMDNLFGRVKEVKTNGGGSEEFKRLGGL